MSSQKFDLNKYPIPRKLFVGGQWVDSKGSGRHTLRSAVNDELIVSDLQWANAEDIELAVESSTQGLKAWQALSKDQRRDALLKYAQLIRQNVDRIFWLEAILTGKPYGFSIFEYSGGADALAYYAGLIDSITGQTINAEEDHIEYTLQQPFGVCAAIVPFNGPIICYCAKVAPALAAGNSIIVKASEGNPFSTLYVASLATEAGIPDGVINCVVGGAEAGAALASHMKIRKISFTGSVATGKHVQIAAVKSNLKSVTLELGGKSPIIIFEDADLDAAAKGASQFLVLNGQGCMLGTRLYVHESIRDTILSRLQGIAQAYEQNIGSNPLEPTTWSSPLFNERQKQSVLSFIESGKSEATLLTGGDVVGSQGCYIQPTIFVDPKPNARILKEEIFGPVLVVSSFKTDDEVLEKANDSEYGLAAYVWTKDMGRALRFSQRLETGTVGINGPHFNKATPFGGWKQSGQGVENGIGGLNDWLLQKSVRLNANTTAAMF